MLPGELERAQVFFDKFLVQRVADDPVPSRPGLGAGQVILIRPFRQSSTSGARVALDLPQEVRAMPSVQIKNVPPDVHRVLRQRAAAAGQSLQEYLLAQLRRQAETETLEEVLDRAGGRAGGSLGFDFAAKSLRDDRRRAA